jgi:hypothetical protein
MMRKFSIWPAILISALILSTPVCKSPGETEDPTAAVELRTYEVPEGYKNELASQLRYVLQGSEESAVGRVIEGTGNRLVVVAPPGIHEGLRSMVRELADLPPVPAPSQARLTYWVVSGRPTEASATSDRPFVTTGPAGLHQIEPVLAGIAETQGPTEFRLLERIELVSTGHDRAAAYGQVVRVTQRVAVSGETVVAQVDVNLAGVTIGVETEVVIRRGQYLVLGQGGVPHTHTRETKELQGPDVTLYYVVAADF